ncbi:MAG TPA: ornithine cyclodeaminase family protein [Candidatus Angelobacter sp.]
MPAAPDNPLHRDGVLLLRRADVAELLPMGECINAVEDAFRCYGRNELPPPGLMGVPCGSGGFHIKTAIVPSDGQTYFAAKTNANFPENPKRFSLPSIQGVVVLFDGINGCPLAVMDSIEITVRRTAAATAVAARYLARAESRVVTICGCGAQAEAQLKALRMVLPIERCFAFDIDVARAAEFARRIAAQGGVETEVICDLPKALAKSDVCVTCTPSREAFVHSDDVRPGTFIAAVGADNPEKQEIDPRLLQRSKVVADVLEQCAAIGELHHALDVGIMTRAEVHAELGAIVGGSAAGRESADETTIFDSTGTALQDAAAAVVIYQKALKNCSIQRWMINSQC